MTVHTGTLRGGTIELDDPPDLPGLVDSSAGRRVRVTVEPAADAAPTDAGGGGDAAGTSEPSGFERSFGVMKDYPEEVDAFIEETYRLRRMTREEARRLRGEE